MPLSFTGKNAPEFGIWYIGPDPALDHNTYPERHYGDTISDEAYAACRPDTRKVIDDLVERKVLVQTRPAKGKE
jgi:hypothetical protein